MTPAIYEKLSKYYDRLWAPYSLRYLNFINVILKEMPILQARILDIACGTGTLSQHLGQDGHIVHGIDRSLSMIKQAQRKTKDYPNINYSIQNMSRFSFREKYDLAICMFDSINYLLEVKEIDQFFLSVRDVLDDDGVFLFDINEEKQYSENYEGVFTRYSNGEAFILRRSYDSARKIATSIIEFSDGAMEVHKQKQYELSHILKSLQAADMRIYKYFGNDNYEDTFFQDNRTVCLVKKQ